MQTAVRPSPRRLAGRAALSFAAAATTLLPAAHAAVYTWTGQRGSGGWGDSSLAIGGGVAVLTTNWGVSNSSYIFPASAATTSLVFGPTTGPKSLTNDLANPFTLNTLTFTSNASAYTIGGNPLAFTANGGTAPSLVTNAANAETLNTALTLNNNLNVSVNSSGDLSLTGRLAGTGGLYKSGTGTLVLSGGTTASPSSVPFLHVSQGPAYISGGALNLTSAGSTGFGGESSLFVEANSSLTINNGAQVTASATPQIHNNGVLYVDGAGTSLHVVDAPGVPADLRVGYAGGTNYLSVSNGATLTVDGDLHLGNSAYAANPGRGILQFPGGGATVTVAHALTLDGATDSLVSIVDGSLTVGSLRSAGSSAPRIFLNNPSAGGAALTVGTDNSDSLFAGNIHGSGTLQKVGTGTLTLSGVSDYTGGTNLVAGTLRLAVDNALSPAGRVAFPAGGSATLDLDGHALTVANLVALADDDAITLGSGTLTVTGSGAQSVFAGVIQDGPRGTGGRVVMTGLGSLNLAGTNTYTGGTTIANGAAIVVSKDANLGAPNAPLTLDGGYLLAVGSFSSARPVAVPAAESFVDTTGQNVTFTGPLSGTGVLTVEGAPGSLTLAGSTGTLGGLSTYFAYPGRLLLDHASLSLTSTGSTGSGTYSSLFADKGSVITLQNGTTLTTAGYPQIHNSGSIVVDGPATVWTNHDANPGNGPLGQVRVGFYGGTSTLAVRNGATVNTPQLLIGAAATRGTGAVTVSSGARLNVADALWITNGSSLAVDRASVTAGYLSDYGNDGKPAASISLTDPAGAPGTALVLNNATGVNGAFAGPITDGPNGPGGITYNATGWQTLYNASYSGPTTVNAGTLALTNNAHAGSFTANTGGTLFFSNVTLNPGAKSLTANGTSSFYYQGTTVNGGFLRGTGTHIFQNVDLPSSVNGSTFIPGSHVTNGGNVTFTNVTSGATIINYGPLTWDGGYNTAAGTLHLFHDASTDFFENDGAIVVYNGATLSNSVSNLVSGGGSSITVQPAAAIKLNSTALELHAATLVNNGAVSGGPTLVYANSTANGSGAFGPLTLLAGGTFSPGNSPGSATTASAAWTSGGIYLFELARATGTAGTDWDLWHIDGNLTVTASQSNPFFLDIAPYNLPDFDPARSYDWTIADVTGAIINFDPAAIVLRPQGVCLCDGTYSLTQTGGDIILHYNPVPEPGSLVAACGLALPLLARRRRRQD